MPLHYCGRWKETRKKGGISRGTPHPYFIVKKYCSHSTSFLLLTVLKISSLEGPIQLCLPDNIAAGFIYLKKKVC